MGYHHVKTEILESGRKPRCPRQLDGCDFTMSQPDVESLLQLSVDSTERQREARRIVDVLGTLDMPAGSCRRCPGCGCWVESPEDGEDRCQCRCGTSFCKLCESYPYHFGAPCEALPRIFARFARWRREGRETYLWSAVEHMDTYWKELREYEEKRTIYEHEANEAFKRCEENQKDERWKALHCRHCPNCTRLIQKLQGGCERMTCGVDGHGGNTQQGCGHQFQWSKAKKYVPSEEHSLVPVLGEFTLKRPELLRGAHWPSTVGDRKWLACDCCHGPIIGPRFDCIHCPSFVCCVHCEAAAAMGELTAHLDRGHVFKVRLSPFDADGEQDVTTKQILHKSLDATDQVEQDPVAQVEEVEASAHLPPCTKEAHAPNTVETLPLKPETGGTSPGPHTKSASEQSSDAMEEAEDGCSLSAAATESCREASKLAAGQHATSAIRSQVIAALEAAPSKEELRLAQASVDAAAIIEAQESAAARSVEKARWAAEEMARRRRRRF